MNFLVKSAIVMLASLAMHGVAQAEPLVLENSKSVPLRLTGSAATIVVGNKNIADVAVHDERLLFVTGKSFGTTNLLIFDKSGQEIYNSDVVVTSGTSNLLTVNRAGSYQTYDCSPVCRSALSQGDDPDYFTSIMQQQLQTQALSEGN